MDEPAIRCSLSAERQTTLRHIEETTRDFDGIASASTDANADDEHDPEGATIAYERAQVASLLHEARTYLGDLDRAEVRLAAGTYLVCNGCNGPITPQLLAARPATRTCIGCAAAVGPR